MMIQRKKAQNVQAVPNSLVPPWLILSPDSPESSRSTREYIRLFPEMRRELGPELSIKLVCRRFERHAIENARKADREVSITTSIGQNPARYRTHIAFEARQLQ
jgi:hypothetical protein